MCPLISPVCVNIRRCCRLQRLCRCRTPQKPDSMWEHMPYPPPTPVLKNTPEESNGRRVWNQSQTCRFLSRWCGFPAVVNKSRLCGVVIRRQGECRRRHRICADSYGQRWSRNLCHAAREETTSPCCCIVEEQNRQNHAALAGLLDLDGFHWCQ